MAAQDQYASVRYIVDDVQAAIDFYTTHLGFTANTSAVPAFAEIARLRSAGLSFRSDVVAGPGGRQILLADPAGNLIELFQPAQDPVAPGAGTT